MRERLIELMKKYYVSTAVDNGEFIEITTNWEEIADHLLAEGVIVPPKQTEQEKLWEKNEELLRYGAFGSLYGEECYYTMLEYWKAQAQAGYPYASDNVKCFELMIAERNKQ